MEIDYLFKSKDKFELNEFYEALYDFILYVDTGLSVEANINNLIENYSEQFKNLKSEYGPTIGDSLFTVEKQADYMNIILNKKRKMSNLLKNVSQCMPLLEKILIDQNFRKLVKNDLEQPSSEETKDEHSFLENCIDTLVKILGNPFGWYSKK